MNTGDWAVYGLAATGLLAYGAAHGALVVWVWRRREELLVPTLLFVSPVGVSVCLLAAMPFVGLVAVLTVLAAMAVGFAPIALFVGWAILHQGGGLR